MTHDLLHEVRLRPLPQAGVVLCSIVHDELYFLPAFLAHYRALGVAHFVFLDDRSTDGTAAFLSQEPDCSIVGSPYRYFDAVGPDRAVERWRNALLDRFGTGRWAILADADEFLALPEGFDLARVTAMLDARGETSVWGLMLDLYPASVEAVRAAPAGAFSLADGWFFDGVAHLSLRAAQRPAQVYPGARDRLMRRHGGLAPPGIVDRLRMRLGMRNRVTHRITISKVPLMRWSSGHAMHGSHRVTPWPGTSDLLAILHCKFTPDLGRKIAYALETGGYVSGSREYRLLGQLMARMEAAGAGFLDDRSVALDRPGRPYDTPAAWIGEPPGTG